MRPGNALPRTQGPTAGVVELVREEGALIMTLTATDAELEHLERVVGTHLARFGQKDGLARGVNARGRRVRTGGGRPGDSKGGWRMLFIPRPTPRLPRSGAVSLSCQERRPRVRGRAVGAVSRGVRAELGLPAGPGGEATARWVGVFPGRLRGGAASS